MTTTQSQFLSIYIFAKCRSYRLATDKSNYEQKYPAIKLFFSLRSLILGALTTGMELLEGLQYLLTTCQPISGSYVGRQKECLVSDLLG